MKEQINKLGRGAAGFGLFLAGCVVAGLGLSMVFLLAMFALAIAGLGLLVSPLVAIAGRNCPETSEQAVA